MQATFDLRTPLSDDEASVLRQEELSLRQPRDTKAGNFVTRPEMGDEFLGNSQIIQYESADVGCVITSPQDDCIHIDHLNLRPEARGGQRVVDYVRLEGERRGKRVLATIPVNSDTFQFFAATGFRVVSQTSKTMKLEWPLSSLADMTDGTGNV